MDQIQPFFSQVTMTRYEDNLQITEIEPILDYIYSSIHISELSEGAVWELRNDLEAELKEKGNIFIQKDSGLFEAIK